MTLTINALDNQFAVSTGANVNSSAGQSTFDYPPTSTTGLVITSQTGDPSPYIFSPGDVYTLSFSGNGGTTITNATVLRSDFVDQGGDQGYAVVFEGLDSGGNLTQVVWTPEFDLEAWYWNNFSAGNPPEFYNSDQDAATTYAMVCFAADTDIATPSGPVAVGALKAGDAVLARDGGVQHILWIVSRRVRGWGRHAPVVFAAGRVGNAVPLRLSQQHRVLVTGEAVRDRYGTDEVLVPAVSFVDGHGVRVAPCPWITYVHFMLDRHDVVTAAGGAPCETLLLGATARAVLLGEVDEFGASEALSPLSAMAQVAPARHTLSVRAGKELLRDIGLLQRRAAPAVLLSPGRQYMRPYRVPPAAWDEAAGGLPAYLALSGPRLADPYFLTA